MNLSDIVTYCKSKQSSSALLLPDRDIMLIGPNGDFLNSGINISEDQIDGLILTPLDMIQTAELNDKGYINFYLSLGSDFLSLSASIDQGKLRAVIEIIDSFSPDQTYNYKDFKLAIASNINRGPASLLAYNNCFAESAILSSYLDYCQQNKLKLLTIGVNSKRLAWATGLSGDGALSSVDLGDNPDLIIESGILTSSVADRAMVFVSLNSASDLDLLDRLLRVGSQVADKVTISLKFKRAGRFRNLISSLRKDLSFKDFSSYFAEDLIFKTSGGRGRLLLTSSGEDDNSPNMQLALVANELNLSPGNLKNIIGASETSSYDKVLDLI